MSDDFQQPGASKEFDRYGRYLLPDPETGAMGPWTRATTLARTLSDEYALNQWRVRQTVLGMGLRHDLAVLAAATGADETGQLQEIGDQAQSAAESAKGANLGRAFHSFTQRVDAGGQSGAPAAYLPYLDVYRHAVMKVGFRPLPVYIERKVVNPPLRAAGRFDRLIQPIVPSSGRLSVADLKTTKLDSIEYIWLETAIQLAVYAYSTHMWNQDRGAHDLMPDVDRNTAFVIHLPQDVPAERARCDVYEIEIEQGYAAALDALHVRDVRKAAKKWVRKIESVTSAGTPAAPLAPVPAVAEPLAPLGRVASATSREELSALWREGTASGWWTVELAAAGRARLAEL